MKRLGQHFLTNRRAAAKIASALVMRSGDLVVEIGAGRGELTTEIFKKSVGGLKIIAIEKDKRLAKLLRRKFAGDENIKIIEGDALKILPELTGEAKIGNWKLIGNIPYYITGKLLRTMGGLQNKPALAVLTMQKEVAERVVSAPPNMNRLAASVQFWAEPRIVMALGCNDFNPPPGVESAAVELKTKKNLPGEAETKKYYSAVRAIFAQPRKTILNNISAAVTAKKIRLSAAYEGVHAKNKIKKALQKLKINPSDRPQNLSLCKISAIGNNLIIADTAGAI